MEAGRRQSDLRSIAAAPVRGMRGWPPEFPKSDKGLAHLVSDSGVATYRAIPAWPCSKPSRAVRQATPSHPAALSGRASRKTDLPRLLPRPRKSLFSRLRNQSSPSASGAIPLPPSSSDSNRAREQQRGWEHLRRAQLRGVCSIDRNTYPVRSSRPPHLSHHILVLIRYRRCRGHSSCNSATLHRKKATTASRAKKWRADLYPVTPHPAYVTEHSLHISPGYLDRTICI
ncbi:hypothetical protein B0T16DRAFT_420034 [Cercophora newfieldiana]|uniref:Uncharacterized protein n=1 Tax=Cercophora newfieldiana TaxID=92897 RepID=A0AA39XXU1_9PEZI|nr:hypothetical protein B0T16DRAFT_420034 [Cercophora newfieldiana]